MRRSVQIVLVPSVAVVVCFISRNADATTYTCTSTTANCFVANNIVPFGGPALTSVFGQTSGGTAIHGIEAANGTAVLAEAVSGEATGDAVDATNNGTGYGVYASSAGGIGVLGYSNYGGFGVVGTLSENAPSVSAGVYGDGSGVGYGVYGVSSSSSGGVGVYGKGESGVFGISTTSGNNGVFGQATAGYGLSGQDLSSGYGVYGQSDTGKGIYGTCLGAGCIAVYGNQGDGSWAGFFTGGVYISGTLSCGVSCNSDVRLKQNVRPLADALDRLLQLKGVTFEWKNPEEHQNHSGTQTGVIAQEVEKIFPQWVHETPDTKVKNVDPDARTVLALTVEAFREVQTENDSLKKHAKEQDERIERLENSLGINHRISWGNANGLGMAFAGAAIAGALFMSRRKREEERS
jgi:hypothetical protein